MDAVEARGLVKVYRSREKRGLLRRGPVREVTALRGVSFRVRRGEIFGLLGPNGAGKTTTIKILATLLIPDAGEAYVNGYSVLDEPERVRESIGLTLSVERGFYWKLTGRENLMFFARLYHIPEEEARERVDRLLELVGLSEAADKLVEEYSLGMKAKLSFARALLPDAPVVMLDEPTLGLDPRSAREVRGAIRRLRREGKAVILTTHYMGEAEELSDRVAIIDRGRIVAEGSPEELKSRLGRGEVVVIRAANLGDGVAEELGGVDGVAKVSARSEDGVGVLRIALDRDGASSLPEIMEVLVRNSVKIIHVSVEEPTLEDVFIELTGRPFEDEG